MKNDLEKKVMRKVTLRIIPFIMLLYFIAFLDRVNIGFAALTMNQDLGFSPTVFGLGAGIFFLGYFLFEVPSNLILHKVGARIWIARVMITLGIRLWLHGFCAGHDELLHSAFSARRGGSRFLPGGSFSISATGFLPPGACAGHCHLYGRSSPVDSTGIAGFGRTAGDAWLPWLRRLAVDVCTGSFAGAGARCCGSVLPDGSSGQGQMAD